MRLRTRLGQAPIGLYKHRVTTVHFHLPHHPHSPQEMKRSREHEDYLDSDSEAYQPEVSLRPVSKYTGLDLTTYSDSPDTGATIMRCSLPPHKEPLSFRSYDEYESHYQKFHAHRCLECRKNFPSEHLLGIHIEECHDPLVVIKRDRGEHTVGWPWLASMLQKDLTFLNAVLMLR